MSEPLTWKDLKDAIEQHGVHDDDVIGSISISGDAHQVHVEMTDEDDGPEVFTVKGGDWPDASVQRQPRGERKVSPELCAVGDFVLLSDDPEVFQGMDSPAFWLSPEGTTWRFEEVEIPCEGGSDFGWRRVA